VQKLHIELYSNWKSKEKRFFENEENREGAIIFS
jgi:hypothetical protein